MQHFSDNSGLSDSIRSLLRLEEEPCAYIDEITCHNIMMSNCLEFMQLLDDFYSSWHRDNKLVTLPYKQVFADSKIKGDFRLMPCILPKAQQKFVKVIGSNEEERTVKDKICVGKSLLIDHYDNHVFAILDVCALSSFRTAAISVLAYQLCTDSISGVGIIGSGRIGFYTAYILNTWLEVKTFYVSDINPDNLKNFRSLCEHYLPDINIKIVSTAECLESSQAIFLTTDSKSALINNGQTSNIKFISSVGADADNLSELDASLLKEFQVISDSIHSISLGDMKRWCDKGIMQEGQLVEIKDIKNHKVNHQKTLFISTGIAVQDALINHFVYKKVRDHYD